MKLPKSCKIELVTHKDPARAAIGEPYLQGPNLIATNGNAIVVIPVERSPEDTDGYVTRQALQAARRVGASRSDAEIRANGALTLLDGTQFVRPTEFKFVDYKQAIPQDAATSHPLTIALNVKKLWEMAQAMGCEHVRIRIKDNVTPFVIEPLGIPSSPKGALGVLNSYRIS